MRSHTRSVSVSMLVSVLVGALVPASGNAAQRSESVSDSNAMLRVELVDRDGGTRVRANKAVRWSQTATLSLDLAGHTHALSITPHAVASGVALDVDHARDGAVVADDVHVEGADRRVVLDGGDTTVVITVVPVKTTTSVE
ncbi:MAG: hypothetical protein K1X88_12955 [Nannocystaceae bacterium]|nr:hypothetical protein [Nannocystaceae bacterium]